MHMQGWDLVDTILQSYKDALPPLAAPALANGKMHKGEGHEDGSQLSEYILTVHMVIIDILATGQKGIAFPLPTRCSMCPATVRLSVWF